jgi:hypothetical protein
MDDSWTQRPRTSIVIRNNSALQSILVRWSNGTAAVRGNIIPDISAFFCNSFGQNRWFDYNVYSAGVPCGRHDRIGDPRYVDAANFDLHLRAGSAALDQADPDDHPALDIDRKRRPLRSRPDAGASQRESADLTLEGLIGNARLGSAERDIVRFYGVSDDTSGYSAKGQSGTLATYRVHGGKLWVLYDRRRTVVGLGTTSPYYTVRSYGVGSLTRRFVSPSFGLRWVGCEKAYRGDFGQVVLYVASNRLRPAARLDSASVYSLWVVRRSFAGCGLRRPR